MLQPCIGYRPLNFFAAIHFCFFGRYSHIFIGMRIRIHRPVFGVPITVLQYSGPDGLSFEAPADVGGAERELNYIWEKTVYEQQFEIVGVSNHYEMAGIPFTDGNCYCEVGGKRKYVRIFIRRHV